jgi:tripartite-type tricarboxylate transporter receptor subunit TctC
MNDQPRAARRRILQSLAGAAAATALPAWSQLFASRTVRLIVTQPPGDPADVVARAISEALAKSLGQAVVVENRPGAGGAVGALAVAQAAPDALTLLLAQTQSLAIAPFAADKPPFDPIESFTHISGLAGAPCVLLSPPQANLTSLADLEARARSTPLAFATPGPLSIGHLYGELLKQALKLNLVHLPTRGRTVAQELAAGTPLAIDMLPPHAAQLQAGQVNGIAVTSPDRSALAPDVPSLADFGHAKLALENFYGVSAPAKLPAGHVQRVTAACQFALAQPDVQKKLAALGLKPLAPGGGPLAQLVKSQAALLAPAVRATGLRA